MRSSSQAIYITVGTLSSAEAIRGHREYLFKNGITSSDDHMPASLRITSAPRKESSLPVATVMAGQLVLGSRSNVTLEWPHIVFKDNSPCEGIQTAISLDGKCIATSFNDSSTVLWNVHEVRAVFQLEGHSDVIETLAFSPDSTRLASGDKAGVLKVWDVRNTAVPYQEHSLQDGGARLRSSVFSHDGKMLAAGYFESKARIWDIENGRLLHILEHHPRTRSVHFAWSPDSRALASCSGSIWYIWDVKSGGKKIEVTRHMNNIKQILFSNDGERIVTASDDNTARIWDAHTGDELLTIGDHYGPVLSAAFSPDGSEIVTTSYNHHIIICDTFNGKRRRLLNREYSSRGPIYGSAYSKSGGLLATSSDDGLVRLWDAAEGTLIANLRGHERGAYTVAFNQDDSAVISASAEGTVRIWNICDVLALY